MRHQHSCVDLFVCEENVLCVCVQRRVLCGIYSMCSVCMCTEDNVLHSALYLSTLTHQCTLLIFMSQQPHAHPSIHTTPSNALHLPALYSSDHIVKHRVMVCMK